MDSTFKLQKAITGGCTDHFSNTFSWSKITQPLLLIYSFKFRSIFPHYLFFWPWQHRGWPSQQLLNPFPSVSVNLWPMTSSSNLT